MKSMVVLFAVVAAACGSLVPLAQPPHHPAIVLDPHGRPLDTAEVIGARALHLQAKALEGHYAPLLAAAPLALAAPVALAAPAAVSHQSRVDVRSSPAIVSSVAYAPLAHAAPLAYAAPLAHAAPLGWASHGGHYLKKRSLAPVLYSAPSAVSHQSRVDVVSSPALVSSVAVAPLAHHAAPVLAHAAPVLAPAAVSHQSRVDVRSSPALVSSVAYAPVAHAAPLAYAAPWAHGAPLAYSSLHQASPLLHAW